MRAGRVRPARVPAAIAVLLPCCLAAVSLLAAVLSLLVSAVLMVLAVQLARDASRNTELEIEADLLLGLSGSGSSR